MIAPPPLPAPPAGVLPNWRHAFGGVWRLTYRRVFTLNQWLVRLGLFGGLAFLTVVNVRHGSSQSFFEWTTLYYLGVFVPILTFLTGGGSLRDEMKPGTVDYVFTRPVRRTAFVAFNFLSHLACVQAIYLVALAVLVGVGFRITNDTSRLLAALPLLVTAQVVTVTAFIAFGHFCASLTGRWLVLGITYAGIIEIGLGNAPIALSRLSIVHQVKTMLQPVIDGFDAGTAPHPLQTVAILGGISAAWVAVAAVLFSLRELAGQKPKES